MRSIVLLSGGLDSTVALYWAKKHTDIAAALTLNYNQRHWVEIAQAGRIVREAGVKHQIDHIGAAGIGLRGLAANAAPVETFQAAVVPCRNLLFLTIAATWAEKLEADSIIVGFSQADAADFPDCRRDFLLAAEKAINLSLYRPLHLCAPLIEMNKKETLTRAKDLGCWEALRFTWTCYTPERAGERTGHVRPCGVCPACRARAQAFADFGEPDPAAGREVRA
jgi:7-cyano-7-deazaguanine synthase